MPHPTVAQAILTVLDELVAGPDDPQATWIVSNEPNTGLLGTLAKLTAAQASYRPPTHANTIAAHANHVRFFLDGAYQWIVGPPPQLDWDQSWAVQTVNDAAWAKLLDDLRTTHEKLRGVIPTHDLEDASLVGAIATPAHVAYHLGAIRQLVPQALAQARS